jgi:hypothetical protein
MNFFLDFRRKSAYKGGILSALLPTPSSGWMDEGKSQNPGAMRRGND